MQSFDIHFNLVKDSKDSILAAISGILVPLFQPLGLGDWRICTSLISGFMAKESVVSSLQILFGNSVTTAISSLGAASLLVFSLLYTPCVAAIASIRREMGRKWADWCCVLSMCSCMGSSLDRFFDWHNDDMMSQGEKKDLLYYGNKRGFFG